MERDLSKEISQGMVIDNLARRAQILKSIGTCEIDTVISDLNGGKELEKDSLQKGEISDKIAYGYGGNNDAFKFSKSGKELKATIPGLIMKLEFKKAMVASQMLSYASLAGSEPTEMCYPELGIMRFAYSMCYESNTTSDKCMAVESPSSMSVVPAMSIPKDVKEACCKYNDLTYTYKQIIDDIVALEVIQGNVEDDSKYTLTISQLIALEMYGSGLSKAVETGELLAFKMSPEEMDLVKGGEGSKGGKVIGHTKSGKPIYDSFNHESHKDFSEQDHRDAWSAQREHRNPNDMKYGSDEHTNSHDSQRKHDDAAKKANVKEHADTKPSKYENLKGHVAKLESRNPNNAGSYSYSTSDPSKTSNHDVSFEKRGDTSNFYTKHLGTDKRHVSHADNSTSTRKIHNDTESAAKEIREKGKHLGTHTENDDIGSHKQTATHEAYEHEGNRYIISTKKHEKGTTTPVITTGKALKPASDDIKKGEEKNTEIEKSETTNMEENKQAGNGTKVGVFLKGIAAGMPTRKNYHPEFGELIKSFDTAEEAEGFAKANNDNLSVGEKGHYKMAYHTKPVVEDQIQKSETDIELGKSNETATSVLLKNKELQKANISSQIEASSFDKQMSKNMETIEQHYANFCTIIKGINAKPAISPDEVKFLVQSGVGVLTAESLNNFTDAINKAVGEGQLDANSARSEFGKIAKMKVKQVLLEKSVSTVYVSQEDIEKALSGHEGLLPVEVGDGENKIVMFVKSIPETKEPEAIVDTLEKGENSTIEEDDEDIEKAEGEEEAAEDTKEEDI